MARRTTIELDDELLTRAREALGEPTIRATVEEALRRAVDQASDEHAERARRQRHYLDSLAHDLAPDVLASDEMWR